CGTDLDGRFCESCGHDSEAPAAPVTAPVDPAPAVPDPAAAAPDRAAAVPPVAPSVGPPARPGSTRTAAGTWRAVVRADRAWFDEVRRQPGLDVAALEFPRYAAERRFVLAGAQMAIGRRSASRGTSPEIDLTGLDPGVS